MQEAVATRPLVPTWHAPKQHRACETASDRAAARNIGATARGDASRASAERARAADAPRAPSTHGGTPRAGGGRRGSLVNPNGGECGRGGCDTAEASSCREDHVSQQPEKERKVMKKATRGNENGAQAAEQVHGARRAPSRSGLAPQTKLGVSGSRPGGPLKPQSRRSPGGARPDGRAPSARAAKRKRKSAAARLETPVEKPPGSVSPLARPPGHRRGDYGGQAKQTEDATSHQGGCGTVLQIPFAPARGQSASRVSGPPGTRGTRLTGGSLRGARPGHRGRPRAGPRPKAELATA